MSDPVTVRGRLSDLADELGRLSKSLNDVQEELQDVEKEYQDAVDEFEVELYLESEKNGKRLPSEALRQKLARREMDAELVGTRDGLLMKRSRLQERIRGLKAEIDAERSILSALKAELEAVPDGTYGGARRVT